MDLDAPPEHLHPDVLRLGWSSGQTQDVVVVRNDVRALLNAWRGQEMLRVSTRLCA